MARLGWETNRVVKINGKATRGYTYDLESRGIAQGEWDKYRSGRDDVLAECVFEEGTAESEALTESDDGRVVLLSSG
jgi:hypothetical protein